MASEACKIVYDKEAAAASGVTMPLYDRSTLQKSWVHFGPSHFFCAHQAFYVHRLNNLLSTLGIAGVGITAISLRSSTITDSMAKQDGLYTLVEMGPEGENLHVVGSIVSALNAPKQSEEMWKELTAVDTSIVSVTVTQKGYYSVEKIGSKADRLPSGRWAIDEQHEDVKYDLAHASCPKTLPGILVEALYRRYSNGVQPFTVLSCDNLTKNGSTLQSVVADLARLQGRTAAFQKWLRRRCAFPDSMVDRIAPQCTPELIDLVKRSGICDERPIPTEAKYTKWVIQKKFCNVRPPLELVGVEFPDNTDAAEMEKLRMLNGAHMAMGVIGTMAGIEYVHEAMAFSPMRTFLRLFHAEMAKSLTAHGPYNNAKEVISALHERLANPAMKDTLIRLTRDITKKLDARFLSAVRDILLVNDNEDAGQASHICFAVAAWMHFVGGENWEVVDPEVKLLKELAQEKNPMAFLRPEWFGDDLLENESFVDQVTSAYRLIETVGMRNALVEYANKLGSRGAKLGAWQQVSGQKQNMVTPKSGKQSIRGIAREIPSSTRARSSAAGLWEYGRPSTETIGF